MEAWVTKTNIILEPSDLHLKESENIFRINFYFSLMDIYTITIVCFFIMQSVESNFNKFISYIWTHLKQNYI